MKRKLIDVEDKLWKKFRLHCLNKDVTISEELDKALRSYLK